MKALAKRTSDRGALRAEAAAVRDARRAGEAAPRLAAVPDPPPRDRTPLHQREAPSPDPLPTRAELVGAARYRLAVAKVRVRHGHRDLAHLAQWAWSGGRRAGGWWWDLATSPDHRRLAKERSAAGDRKGREGHLSAAHVNTGLAALVAVVAASPAPVLVELTGRRAGLALYAVAAVAVLAALGRKPTDRLPSAPAPSSGPALTSDVLLAAFSDTGFAGAKTVGAPAIEGKGLNRRLRVIVDLPPGKTTTASACIAQREQLAANLRRDLACVHLVQGGHAGQVILTILDQDPMAGPPVPSPLLAKTEWCLWDPIPWGFDIAGRTVHLPLLWTSLLVGAKPRMGKTFAIRTIVLAAVLDVHARVYLWDGKGAGDYRMFKPLCARWGQGHSARKGQPAECLKMLREVLDLVDERAELIDGLPTHLRPQGKLTREVSRDPKYRLPLILVVVSELQRLIADDQHGDAIRDALIALAQNAPSCGVILVVDAQRPTQGTGPGSLGDLPPAMGSRAAFKVMSAAESNVVLGGAHASAGWDASIFPDDYEGVCYLRSGADVAEGPKGVQQVKTYYADDGQLEAACAALVARRTDGDGGVAVLERPAAVDLAKPDPPARATLLGAFEADEDRVQLDELAGRLGVDRAGVRALAKAAAVEVRKLRFTGIGTDWGLKRGDLER